MDGIMELAIAVGRLMQRVDVLEALLQEKNLHTTQRKFVQFDQNASEDGPPSKQDRLLQQGIDNIMGYQWPPAKEDG